MKASWWTAMLTAVVASLGGSGCHDARNADASGSASRGANANANANAKANSDANANRDADAGAGAGANSSAGTSAVIATDATALPSGAAPLAADIARQPEQLVPEAALNGAVRANNEFATALFGALQSERAGRNFLISPVSASLALGMTYAGARGQTRAEMARAVHFGALADERLFSGQNALSQQLSKRAAFAFEAERTQPLARAAPLASNFSFEIVNSLWGQAGYPWQPKFLTTLAENYGTRLFDRDFKQQANAARLEINHWVSSLTQDKIQDLLDEPALTKDTRLVLVNALHLKLPWADSFNDAATKPASFTPSNGKGVSVPFMHRQARLNYRDDGSAQIVALPLSSRKLWVVIAVPHAGVSLASYERTLRADSAALVVPAAQSLVDLSLPKVTFTSPSFSLRDALKRLGMVQAFDPDRAHFEGMCSRPPAGDGPLYISDVLQKTMISMQEKGVEAAAATAVVVMTYTSLRRSHKEPVPILMVVNRPYLIAVVDQPTSAVLMLGHIDDPNQ